MKRTRKWFLASGAAVVMVFVAIVNPVGRARLQNEI
jgi:hypothetical protein